MSEYRQELLQMAARRFTEHPNDAVEYVLTSPVTDTIKYIQQLSEAIVQLLDKQETKQ